MNTRVKVAILDDYQNVALSMADWTPVTQRADITVFNDHVPIRTFWWIAWPRSTSSS